MSKLKEQLLKTQDEQMMCMSRFFDYLYDNVICAELNEVELDEIERGKPLPKGKRILSNKTIKQANNKNYFPLQGA